MAIATLTIDIVAKLANLQTGFDRAAQIAEKNARRIEGAFDAVRGTLKTLGAGIGLQQLISAFNATAEGLAKFKDVAESTGIAVEELSKLEPVARGAGLQLDQVASLSLKLSKALSGVDDESRGAGKALAQIGIDLQRFRELGAADQIQTLAVALNGYRDDANKAAIGQAILGKQWESSAGFLKDLAEAGKLNATVTKEQAAAADEYNKNLVLMQSAIRDAARALLSDMLPALNRFSEQVRRIEWDKVFEAFSSNIFSLNKGPVTEALRELGRQAAATGKEIRDAKLQQAAEELERLFNTGGGKPSTGQYTSNAPDSMKKEVISGARLELAAYVEQLDKQRRSLTAITEVENALLLLKGLGPLGDVEQVRQLVLEQARLTDELQRQKTLIKDLESAETIERTSQIRAQTAEWQDMAAALERIKELTGKVTVAQQRQFDILQKLLDLELINEEEFGLGILDALPVIQREAKKTDDLFKDLGLTFSSAFEDAIIGGREFSDVLRGLEQDILRIITRKLVTEPLANLLTGALGNLFGASGAGGAGGAIGSFISSIFKRESGGPVMGSHPYWVGEQGPEIFVPRSSGEIINANASRQIGRSTTININVPPGTSGASAQQIAAAVARTLAVADARLN